MKEWGEELVGEHGLSSVGAVVGATHPRAVGEARRLMPQAILLLPGVGAQGATPARRRARVHERPRERARDRLPLRHVRGEGGRRELAPRRGRGGAATRTRGLGRRRVVIDRQQVARFAAPAAFLLAVTILVLLVRSATSEDEPRHGDRRRRRHRRRPRPDGARRDPAAGRHDARHHGRVLDLHDRGRRHAADDRRPVRDDRGGAARAQPGRRPDGAPGRPDDPSPLRTTLGFAHVRRCLVALLCVLVLAAPASAAAPEVDARAWLVQNGTTGEVLVQHGADQRVPIASITKLMTVLVALERTEPDDVVVVDRRAAAVGESTIHLRPGERVTVHDLVEAALIQSANDAANALALHVSGSVPAFAALMNRKARAARPARHALRPPRRARRRRPRLERARRHEARPRGDERPDRPLDRAPAQRRGGGPQPLHVERPARPLPRPHRRQDRPHLGRRLVAGGGRARAWAHRLRDHPRRPDPVLAERRPEPAARLGPLPLPGRPGRPGGTRLRAREPAVREGAGGARRLPPRGEGRPHRASRWWSGSSRPCPSSSRCGRASGSASSGSTTDGSSSPRVRSSRGGRVEAPGRMSKVGWYAKETLRNVGGLFS